MRVEIFKCECTRTHAHTHYIGYLIRAQVWDRHLESQGGSRWAWMLAYIYTVYVSKKLGFIAFIFSFFQYIFSFAKKEQQKI